MKEINKWQIKGRCSAKLSCAEYCKIARTNFVICSPCFDRSMRLCYVGVPILCRTVDNHRAAAEALLFSLNF